ncbi:MAG: hypothetical protein K2X86_02470 [Cytophagaceae bacterium]|nr:hypothetical protein [Cytophagaceae bacterium]
MKTKENYRSYFNFLVLAGLIVALCSVPDKALGQNNDILSKQSLRFENSQSNVSETTSPGKAATPSMAEAKKETAPKEIAKPGRNEVKKLTPVQKMLVKKLAKKMNPDSFQGEQQGQALDQNLKFAIIFGAIGVVLMLFPSPLWIIGAIALTVGVVFLILWVLEQ